ncbi:hypothetical protein WH47_09057 [Habropoda laboriosa]|uniref:Uncharacterized protein n=1 Tax=Habropoda laboriosa TaxID=597456 RepID=A0A0L7QLN9_9HYME|nr:hypothetical protein WH47_09057 [Habropoda laboriosa]
MVWVKGRQDEPSERGKARGKRGMDVYREEPAAAAAAAASRQGSFGRPAFQRREGPTRPTHNQSSETFAGSAHSSFAKALLSILLPTHGAEQSFLTPRRELENIETAPVCIEDASPPVPMF